jgi:hypothetical protein
MSQSACDDANAASNWVPRDIGNLGVQIRRQLRRRINQVASFNSLYLRVGTTTAYSSTLNTP